MTDDVGFSAPSTFGGVIPTPALDRVASMGLRYTRFHTTALCSPTRAALLTGRNHHSVGHRRRRRPGDRLPRLQQRDPARRRRHRRDPAAERLRHVLVRQGPQRAAVGGKPGGAVPQLADRPRQGLRLLLRLHRRRHQPMAAEQPVPQHHADRALSGPARLEPHHRHGRRGDRAHQDAERGPARPAVHDLLRARRHALAASSDARSGWTRSPPCTSSTRAGTSCATRIFANQKRTRRDPAERRSSHPGRRTSRSGTRSRPRRRSSTSARPMSMRPTWPTRTTRSAA